MGRSVRERLEEVQSTLVFFNNHFAGYAPASANEFLGMFGRELPGGPFGPEPST
jgi:hypothetical protein